MADVSDVAVALRNAVASSLYPPNGVAGVGGAGSVTGSPTRISVGWPNPTELNGYLTAKIVNVTIFPRNGMTRRTTRYQNDWWQGTVGSVTLTGSISGHSVTIGGAAGSVQVAGIRTNAGAWAVAVASTDGPTQVAAKLAAIIPGAAASGAVVTVPGAGIDVRFGAVSSATMETRRQEQGFMVCIWAPNNALRDTTATVIDAALSQIDFLPLPDGSTGRVLYAGHWISDNATEAATWRRDLYYSVEYPTTAVEQATQALFIGGVLTTGASLNVNSIWGDVQPYDGNVETDGAGNVYLDGGGNLMGEPPS